MHKSIFFWFIRPSKGDKTQVCIWIKIDWQRQGFPDYIWKISKKYWHCCLDVPLTAGYVLKREYRVRQWPSWLQSWDEGANAGPNRRQLFFRKLCWLGIWSKRCRNSRCSGSMKMRSFLFLGTPNGTTLYRTNAFNWHVLLEFGFKVLIANG